MKKLEELPLDSKVDGKPNEVNGSYAFAHPWIKDYIIKVDVTDQTNLVVTLFKEKNFSKAMRHLGKKAAPVLRWPTIQELQTVRNVFFDDTELVHMIIAHDIEDFKAKIFKVNEL